MIPTVRPSRESGRPARRSRTAPMISSAPDTTAHTMTRTKKKVVVRHAPTLAASPASPLTTASRIGVVR